MNLPVWFTSRNDAGSQGPTLGDARMSVPVGIVLPEDSGGFGLSVIPHLDLPTGDQSRFLGNDGPHGGASIAVGWEAPKWAVTANVRGDVGKARDYMNLDSSFRTSLALAGGYRLTKAVAVRLESTLNTDLRKNAQPGTDAPWEVALSARGRHQNGISWTAGGAAALNGGVSAATFRVFAGAGYVFGKDAPQDTDGDGFVDLLDQCPLKPEVFNDWQDDDGCPDDVVPFTVTVTDPTGAPLAGADIHVDSEYMGRTNNDGQWTGAPHPVGLHLSVTAGPPRDNNQLRDSEDVALAIVDGAAVSIPLAYAPGRLAITARKNGEPMNATVSFSGEIDHLVLGDDGDGHTVLPPGTWTAFIEAPGMALEWRTVKITPEDDTLIEWVIDMSESSVQATSEEVVLLQAVEFEFDSSAIKPSSYALITEVAANLQRYSEVALVELQGHTDSHGSSPYNRDLSQRRVDAAMAYMTAQGVSADRLIAVGYGEDCPISSNQTESGREENRRVQFIILDPAPPGDVPCHNGSPASRAQGRVLEVEDPASAEFAP
ncbi:MAG: outer membrane protein OmpA-like peptidoglycan-associated protein [Myxococcota bacterium]